jgi:hypothetical protein
LEREIDLRLVFKSSGLLFWDVYIGWAGRTAMAGGSAEQEFGMAAAKAG